MIDHSSDFDARRIGWWARRSAIRQIRRSTAITDADRTLRLQQAQAAQTRGEISALTRGLTASGPAASAVPPARSIPYTPPPAPPRAQRAPSQYTQPPPSSMRYSPPPRPAPQYSAPPAQSPAGYQPPPAQAKRKRSFHGKVLIGLVIALLACGGGVVSCVSSIVDSVQDFSSDSSSAPDLQTEGGWSEMITAFASRTDLAETISVAVRQSSATLTVRSDDDGRAPRYYYDGDVTTTSDLTFTAAQEVFDLGAVDPAVVTEAVAQARRSSGEPDSTEALVSVWAENGGLRITVEFLLGDAETYSLVVDGDGTVISETP